MSKEGIFLNTSYFSAISNRENLNVAKPLDTNRESSVDTVIFNGKHAQLRLSKQKSELTTGNVSIYDFGQEVQPFYDNSSMANGISHFFGEDPRNEKYKALIAFNFFREKEMGKIKILGQHGAFLYDKNGELGAIRSELMNSERPGEDIPPVCFKQGKYGLWSVLPFGNRDDLALEYYKKCGKLIGPMKADGHKERILEMQYSLLPVGDKMLFSQQSVTGHKQKIIGVPLEINIPEFSRLLGSPDGGWTEIFRKFPSYIEIDK
jgi:hypothetical protein